MDMEQKEENMPPPVKMFLLFSGNNQDVALLKKLRNNFSILEQNNIIEVWSSDMLKGGANIYETTLAKLQEAEFLLALVSSDYLADKDCQKWEAKAVELGKLIIPVLLRPCLYQLNSNLSETNPLPKNPKDGKPKPISQWKKEDDAINAVGEGIVDLVNALHHPQSDNEETTGSRALPPSKRKPQNNKNMDSIYFENGYALLIGVGDYEFCNSLPATVNDAKILQKILKDPKRAAYNPTNVSIVIPNETQKVTCKRILKEFEEFVDKVNTNKDENKTIIIYYSGHGEIYRAVHYICPYDFNTKDGTVNNGISASEFVALINKIQAERILVILDCCYAGGIKATTNIADVLNEGKGNVIIASSTDGQTSKILKNAQYSLFTDILVRGLGGEAMKVQKSKEKVVRIIPLLGYIDTKLREHNLKQQVQINKAESLESFPVCAFDSDYASRNPIKKLIDYFRKDVTGNPNEVLLDQPIHKKQTNLNNSTKKHYLQLINDCEVEIAIKEKEKLHYEQKNDLVLANNCQKRIDELHQKISNYQKLIS